MQQVAECARQGRVALEEWDVAALGKWMDTNFDLRRSMYTDAALGFHNVRMVEVGGPSLFHLLAECVPTTDTPAWDGDCM
jgi:hypothetical protein